MGKYVRKTVDEWEIQAYTGTQYGWELMTTEESAAAARDQIKTYRENEPQYTYRIIKKRVRITEEG